MLHEAYLTVMRFLNFYVEFFADQWHHMTPAKYGTVLIGIGIVGWLLMKSGIKRSC
jgi:hypothetical protein